MCSGNRILTYSLAINEALTQLMANDENVFILGQGVKSPWYVGNTTVGLLERFGESRVIDTPVSENAITGAAVGAAIVGMRPVIVHPRMDFMLYALDPIINEAANWHYMSGGQQAVPVVFWGIINRGGEQAAQHSQALHSLFCHIPGLKVVAPSGAHDAKGLMCAAVNDGNPVMFIDDRWLYNTKEHVPEQLYEVPLGSANLRRQGTDAVIVAFSSFVPKALQASEELARQGISCMVIDLRSLKPIDWGMILDSVASIRRVLICDTGWKTCGIGGEIIATIAEAGIALATPPRRLCLADVPAPASRTLEDAYYPGIAQITRAVKALVDASTGPRA